MDILNPADMIPGTLKSEQIRKIIYESGGMTLDNLDLCPFCGFPAFLVDNDSSVTELSNSGLKSIGYNSWGFGR